MKTIFKDQPKGKLIQIRHIAKCMLTDVKDTDMENFLKDHIQAIINILDEMIQSFDEEQSYQNKQSVMLK